MVQLPPAIVLAQWRGAPRKNNPILLPSLPFPSSDSEQESRSGDGPPRYRRESPTQEAREFSLTGPLHIFLREFGPLFDKPGVSVQPPLSPRHFRPLSLSPTRARKELMVRPSLHHEIEQCPGTSKSSLVCSPFIQESPGSNRRKAAL